MIGIIIFITIIIKITIITNIVTIIFIIVAAAIIPNHGSRLFSIDNVCLDLYMFVYLYVSLSVCLSSCLSLLIFVRNGIVSIDTTVDYTELLRTMYSCLVF